MNSAKHSLGTSQNSRRTKRLARAIAPMFEQMEQRRMMSNTLYVYPNGGSTITLNVTPGGGMETTVDGVKTAYAAGQYGDVEIHTAYDDQPINIQATVVPVSITCGYGQVTLHGVHGMQDIKAMVAIHAYNHQPYHVKLDDSGDQTARTITMEKIGTDNVVGGMAPGNIFFADDLPDTGYAWGDGKADFVTGGGADQVNIKNVDRYDTINMNSFGGADTVSIGGRGPGLICGEVDVNNTPSLTHLVMDYSTSGGGTALKLDGDGTTDTINTYDLNGTLNDPPLEKVHFKVSDVVDVTVKDGNDVPVYVDRTDVPTSVIGNTTVGYGEVYIGAGGAGGGDMRNIQAPVSVSNPTGWTKLGLYDAGDPFARFVQMNAQSITGLSPATISWTAADIQYVRVESPTVGGNIVTVKGTAVPTTLALHSAGQGLQDGVILSNNGSVQGITGELTILNGYGVSSNGNVSLQIDDSADTTSGSATLSVSGLNQSITGLAPAAIIYDASHMTTVPVTINGGSGGNGFTVAGTPTLGPTINLNTGTGADVVNVQATGPHALNIAGQSGLDTVNFGKAGTTQSVLGAVNISNSGQYTQVNVTDSLDSVARTITLDALPPTDGTHPRGSIAGIAPGLITYVANDMKDPLIIKGGSGGNTVVVNNTPTKTLGLGSGNAIELNTGTGVDNVTVKAIGAGTTLNIDGQNGIDPVLVGNNGSVQGILGTVTLRNTNNWESLTIDDSADAVNRIVTLGVLNGAGDGDPLATITGLAPGVINFEANDVVNPTINGGSGANVYTFTGTPTSAANGLSGPTITLNAGAGADIISVVGMGNGTALNINGQGADDSLSVDYSTGSIPLNSGIVFNGGTSGPLGNAVHVKGKANDIFTATAGDVGRGGPGHLTYTNVQSLYCDGGVFNVVNDLNLGALVAQSAATTVDFNASQTIGKLFIDGARAAAAPGGAISLALNTLNIVNNSRLDLADDGLLLTYGNGPDPVATIRGYLLSGYDNGKWDGAGIASSVAQNNPVHNTAIGYADSADGTGVNATPNSIKLMYTLYGDASLDKTVDTLDFNSLAANFGGTGKGWTQADFNYDGKVDTLDFNNLAASFGKSLPAAPAAQANVFSLQRITTDFDAIAQEATSAVA